MYYITEGLGEKWRPLAIFFAIAIAFAAIGSASLFQSNQAALALTTYYNVPAILTGIVLFVISAFTIIGGIERIGSVASKVVPIMCFVYITGALAICAMNASLIPDALMLIVSDAFTGTAAAGGLIGTVIKTGVKRAIFSNEAGIGSAPIAHAAVKTDYPIREGIVASVGPLIDTIIVCTATALVIILSGNYGTEMYQGGRELMSFEKTETSLTLGDGWSTTSNLPVSSDVLRSFIDQDTALEYRPQPGLASPISLPVSLTEDEFGIRFSYYKTGGDVQFTLLDEKGLPIIQAVASESGDLSALAIKNLIDADDLALKGFKFTDEWDSAVLVPTGYLKQFLVSQKSLSLLIQPLDNTEVFFIDRVEPVANLAGVALTTASFDMFFKGFGSIFVVFSVFIFAFSTIITWAYYGETAVNYLFGSKAILPYKWIFVAMILVGSYQSIGVVVNFSDAMLGLLVIPNMIACLLLSGKVARWTKE